MTMNVKSLGVANKKPMLTVRVKRQITKSRVDVVEGRGSKRERKIERMKKKGEEVLSKRETSEARKELPTCSEYLTHFSSLNHFPLHPLFYQEKTLNPKRLSKCQSLILC